MDYIQKEIRDRVGYLILNRPEKRNALNADFVNEIKVSLTEMNQSSEVKAVIIKSSGKVFCAGADLAYLQKLQNFTREENLADSQNLAELFKMIYSMGKPVISLVDGAALAGGCGLATVCDFCFATPDSTFGYTESRIGFIPAIVMVFLRKKVGEATSKRLLFTGEIIKANQALLSGLISEIVEEDVIYNYVHEWTVDLINKSSSHSLSLIKKMYNSIDSLALDAALNYACEMNAIARETEDCKRGISAFLNKEKITW